jgi:hypothetical protein
MNRINDMTIDGEPENLLEWQQRFANTLIDEGFSTNSKDAFDVAEHHSSECNYGDEVALTRDPVLNAYEYIREYNANSEAADRNREIGLQ